MSVGLQAKKRISTLRPNRAAKQASGMDNPAKSAAFGLTFALAF
jgi:hypothetical protein